MKKIKGFVFSCLLLLLLVFLVNVSCNKSEKSEKKVIKIGAILPLTGNLAQTGVPEKNAMMLAVEKANKKLINYKLKIKFYDFEGKPKNALSSFRRAVDIDGCQIIASSTSLSVNTLLPLMKQYENKVLFFPITIQDKVVVSKNVFRVWPNVRQEVDILSSFVNKAKVQNVVLLYPTNQLGIDAYVLFKKELTKKILFEEGHSLQKLDFKDTMFRIKSEVKDLKNTILIAWTYPKQTIMILKEIKSTNMAFSKIITSIGTDYPEVLKFIDDNKIINYFVVPHYDLVLQKSENKFDEIYFKKYGEHSSWNSAFSYDIIWFIFEGLNKLPADAYSLDNLINVFENVKFIGVSGKIEMGKTHEANVSLSLVYYENGEFINVK